MRGRRRTECGTIATQTLERPRIMSNKPIDCEQALKQVYEYLDHELGNHDHEAMAQHLSICKSCFSRVEFEQRLKDKVKALRDEQPTDSASDRIKQLLKGF